MAQVVDIGCMSALDYWHSTANPAYMRFRDTPTKENAIECAKAIEDLRGWRWKEMHPGIDPRADQTAYAAFNGQLFSGCPDLALIKDIAESAKHGGELGRSGVQVKGIAGSGIGGVEQVFGPLGMYERKPECTLRAELHDGTQRRLPEMLASAIKFWRDELLPKQ